MWVKRLANSLQKHQAEQQGYTVPAMDYLSRKEVNQCGCIEMTTIAKEWLATIAEFENTRDDIPFGLDDDDAKFCWC